MRFSLSHAGIVRSTMGVVNPGACQTEARVVVQNIIATDALEVEELYLTKEGLHVKRGARLSADPPLPTRSVLQW